jgi:CheY-like chemotaxis protein
MKTWELGKDPFQVARLAEVGAQTSVLVHEMRQPLTALKTALQLVGRSASGEEGDLLAEALVQLDRLSGLLTQAGRLGAAPEADPGPCSVDEIVRRVLSLLEGTLHRRGIALSLHLGPVPGVLAVPQHLEQILFNLLNNARESLVERGGKGRLAVVARSAGDQVELIVADDGVGIPSVVREQLFQPYTTTKPDGTGLGLYVARRLARLHHGDLQLCEDPIARELIDPPARTAFALRLPAAPEDTPAEDAPTTEMLARELDALRERPPRLLVVCNQAPARHRIEALVKPLGFQLRWERAPWQASTTAADLVLACAVGDPEKTLRAFGEAVRPESLLLVVEPWDVQLAIRALELGCRDVIRMPTNETSRLAVQMTMAAAARDARLEREASLLVNHADLLLSALPEEQRKPTRRELVDPGAAPVRITVSGSPALRRQVSGMKPQNSVMVDLPPTGDVDLIVKDLDPTEQAAGPLARALESLPAATRRRLVVCGESMGLDALEVCHQAEVLAVLSGVRSAPELFRLRLRKVADGVVIRRRLDAALQLLMARGGAARLAGADRRRGRVLLLDDDPVILRLTAKALEAQGHEVMVTATGEEALQVLAGWPADLLVADKNLPDLSGIDVATIARQNHPGLAVLIITGYASQSSVEEALHAGVVDYLLKPFDLDELTGRVGDLLERLTPRPRDCPDGVVLAVSEPEVLDGLRNAFGRRGSRVVSQGPLQATVERLEDGAVGMVVVDLDEDHPPQALRALSAALAARPELVMIVLVTRPDLQKTLDALRLGARGLLRKPLEDPSVVCQVVANACREVCT